MLIKIRPSWEIPERTATPEALVMNRRRLLGAAGAVALAVVIAGCSKSDTAQNGGSQTAGTETPDPTASLYPFERSKVYTLEGKTDGLDKLAGTKAKVTGKVSGKTITVDSAEAAS